MEVVKNSGGEASSSSSKPATVCYNYGGRVVFDIELTPGETTIVSWKKLLRDANKARPPPPGAAPAPSSLPLAAAQLSPVAMDQVTKSKPEDAPPSNRFSAVVEKIERLYVGRQSSDEEELDDVPDDDQYDTDDSFIDDAELDEYFQVDKATTKHNGFFVNKGKLEHKDEPALSANHQQKRPRKKRAKSVEDKGNDRGLNKHSKLGHARMKIGARTAPLVGSNSQNSTSVDCFLDGQMQHSLSASMGSLTNRPADCGIKTEHSTHSGISFKDDSAFPLKTDNCEIQKTAIRQSNVKDASEFSDAKYQKYREKNAVKQFQIPAKRLMIDNDECEFSTKKRRDKNSSDKLPDLNLPVNNDLMQQSAESTSMHSKDVSSVRTKGTMLERAIRELEKVVAESRPQKIEVQDNDTSPMAIKRRLPREVKQKLAKVARLASSQGKISEELINRLMSILGHLMQLRTLKRNLREMVLLGLSAKREKADRFQQIKTEVLEMLKQQGHSKFKASKQRDGATDDFQVELGAEDKGALKGKSSIDNAIEDKICDLYDLYVQGMDEDKGPQMRKLYVELAELWPNGSMDNSGIKSAVERAKERRRALYNHEKVEGKVRRKIIPTPKPDIVRGESASTVEPLAPAGPTSSSSGMVSNMDTNQQLTITSPVRGPDRSLTSSHVDLPQDEKLENLTFPMLKEQMKQQRREIEKRVKKLSLKPEKATPKAHKQQNVSQVDDPCKRLA